MSWAVRIGYGAGDFGLVLTFQLAGLFLLFFMTEALGLSPMTAGLIILAGLLFDGVSDIGMGVLADRFRGRLGGYRPWLLMGGPLLAGSTALMFFAPPLQGVALAAAALGAQVLFRAAFTVVAIPFGALSSAMTEDSRERSLLVGIRLTFASFAALTVALGVPPAVAAFGAGEPRLGFQAAAAAVGLTAMVFILIAYASTREVKPGQTPAALGYLVVDLPGMAVRNGPFLQVAVCAFLYASAQGLILAGAPYFFSFVRGEPETLGLCLGVMIGGVAVFVPVWTVIARRIGKRASWIIGAGWSAAALAGLAIAWDAPLPFFLAGIMAASFGFAAINLIGFSMLPDTVEYAEWRYGVRVEAALFAALTLVQKAGVGFAAAGSGFLLSLAGHSSDSPMAGPGAAMFGAALFLAPAMLLAASIVAIWRYPLSTRLHARLVRALAWRRVRRQR
ncbi:MAG: glycoside-pentoside-hexuronide (GPH):cation symporter [Alphaproteobacteria bacterium]|nr:glycoside-pentoside-hexuronide (GPH):cation symporter [Alphaproteobacteria bacterium]